MVADCACVRAHWARRGAGGRGACGRRTRRFGVGRRGWAAWATMMMAVVRRIGRSVTGAFGAAASGVGASCYFAVAVGAGGAAACGSRSRRRLHCRFRSCEEGHCVGGDGGGCVFGVKRSGGYGHGKGTESVSVRVTKSDDACGGRERENLGWRLYVLSRMSSIMVVPAELLMMR